VYIEEIVSIYSAVYVPVFSSNGCAYYKYKNKTSAKTFQKACRFSF
jgi:hypothetical protein